MRAEKVQFNMLCEQVIMNVFRKNAFRSLFTRCMEMGTAKCDEYLQLSIDLFRDRLDYVVENSGNSLSTLCLVSLVLSLCLMRELSMVRFRSPHAVVIDRLFKLNGMLLVCSTHCAFAMSKSIIDRST